MSQADDEALKRLTQLEGVITCLRVNLREYGLSEAEIEDAIKPALELRDMMEITINNYVGPNYSV